MKVALPDVSALADSRRGKSTIASVLLTLISMIGSGFSPLLGQTTSTTILGTVTDSSGAVVPGVKVTALQVQTGLKREETTSSTGDYSFPLLNVGEY